MALNLDVSIIIVNFNTKDLLRNCLKSIFVQTKDINFEVIVSDNGSIDGSTEMIKNEFPEVVLIENNENLGFGAANNRGLQVAKGKYIFYLNSDTILLNNAVKVFFDYWENNSDKEKIGALGCNLLDTEMNISSSYGPFPKCTDVANLFIRRCISIIVKELLALFHSDFTKYINKPVFEKKIGEVEYVIGADLFMKNDELAKYDERFFLYCEEVDLQFKVANEGLSRRLIEGPEIIHLGGKSSVTAKNYFKNLVRFSEIQRDLSLVRFIKYNRSKRWAFLCKIILSLYWINPAFVLHTRKYYKNLWKI